MCRRSLVTSAFCSAWSCHLVWHFCHRFAEYSVRLLIQLSLFFPQSAQRMGAGFSLPGGCFWGGSWCALGFPAWAPSVRRATTSNSNSPDNSWCSLRASGGPAPWPHHSIWVLFWSLQSFLAATVALYAWHGSPQQRDVVLEALTSIRCLPSAERCLLCGDLHRR